MMLFLGVIDCIPKGELRNGWLFWHSGTMRGITWRGPSGQEYPLQFFTLPGKLILFNNFTG